MNARLFTVSIDVEDFFAPRPPGDMYRGRLPTGDFGVLRIADICESHGVRATFFFDVENVERYVDVGVIRDLCEEVNRRGHEVALHTHPLRVFRADAVADRVLMNYDFEAQYAFIMKCAERIAEWIGKWPSTHRAGSYGADVNTFKALEKANILRDSSVFWGRPQFDFLDEKLHETVSSFKIGRVSEFPVTSFKSKWLFGLGEARRKFDLNWGSPSELLEFADLTQYQRVDLFMHSYSLVDCHEWVPCQYFEAGLHAVLGRLSQRFEVRRFDELPLPDENVLGNLDYEEIHRLALAQYSWEDWKHVFLSKVLLRMKRLANRGIKEGHRAGV